MARPSTTKLAIRRLIVLSFLVFMYAVNKLPQGQIAWLNVGQGLAVYYQSESGWNMLYDTGPARAVASELGQAMSPLTRQIDLVIISHAHADHLEGLLAVLDGYEVKEIWLPPLSDNQLDQAVRQKLKQRPETMIREKAAGDLLIVPGGLLLRHWHPTATGLSGHDATQVVELTNQFNKRLLLTGDLDTKQEQDALLYCESHFICTAEFTNLQVSHHGSKTSTGSNWLTAVKPNDAVISVGENDYGHPADETINRLEGAGVTLFRTDLNGRVLTNWPSQR